MGEREMDILKLRFWNGETLQSIGNRYGLSRERVRQIIYKTAQYIWFEVQSEKHQEDFGIDPVITENSARLMRLFYLLGPVYREKLSRLVTYYKVEKPEDLLKLSRKQITSLKAIGGPFFFVLKMGLYKMGLVYDDKDDFEELERKIDHYTNKDTESGAARLRFKILNRDGFRCQYCGRNPRDDKSTILQVDHITAIANGGSWDESNLITACRECNMGKLHKVVVDKKLLLT